MHSMDIFGELSRMKSEGQDGVLITVIEKEGHGPAIVGTKMLIKSDGRRIGTVGGGALEFAATQRAAAMLQDQRSGVIRFLLSPENDVINDAMDNQSLKTETTPMRCGGTITLFFDYIGSGPRVYLFGAGHIGKALLHHFEGLTYYITLIDSRPGMADALEGAHRRITVDYAHALENEPVPPGSFFIIASHSHELDYVILNHLYQTVQRPKYIGLIASKRKIPAMIDRLRTEMRPDLDLETLYSPIGLDIGGASPEEIAIAIIAELQAVRYGKQGHKHLRQDFAHG
ncbi:MAG: XdhC family protein [Candidatus Omnitrophota bacterium]